MFYRGLSSVSLWKLPQIGGTSIPSWTPGHWLISITCTTVSSSAGSTPEAGIAYLGPMGQGLTWSQASSWSHCFYRRFTCHIHASSSIFMHLDASGVSEFQPQPQWIMNFLIQIQRRIISRRESQVSRAFALGPNAPLRCQENLDDTSVSTGLLRWFERKHRGTMTKYAINTYEIWKKAHVSFYISLILFRLQWSN